MVYSSGIELMDFTSMTVEEKWMYVRLRVSRDKAPAAVACREAGVSYNTYNAKYRRKKKKPTVAEAAGIESQARETAPNSRPDSTSTEAGGQPAQHSKGNNDDIYTNP